EALPLHEGTFEIRAVLVVPEDAPPGPRRIPLVLGLGACNDRQCLEPQEIRLDLALRFAAETGERRHPSLFR
ncbi:MAG: hypothetical protein QNJ90_11640, partial [Planctomycetota bacterium]|nr:hypothetical protein [Planctomycetota bacterium]